MDERGGIIKSREEGLFGRSLLAPIPDRSLQSGLHVTLLVCLILAVIAWAFVAVPNGVGQPLAYHQFVEEDMPVLFMISAFLALLRLWSPPAIRLATDRDRAVVTGMAVGVFLIAVAGAHAVTRLYPLSADEFLAIFDAKIMAGGHLIAPVGLEWRPFYKALQPVFMLDVPGGEVWSSIYLPANAALHMAFERIGHPEFAAALMAALCVPVLYAIARRLWPERRDAAIVAVLLLVTSGQFLVTAMTPYAMTAHLLFNLVWLWLFLRNTRLSHAAAIAVGFVACGLHQVVFHPLFVAPFILALLYRRRFRLAAVYMICYAAIGLFWISYWQFLVPPVSRESAAFGLDYFIERAQILMAWNKTPFVWTIFNTGRFLAWQNPLAIVLCVSALMSIRRWVSPLPELLGGVLLLMVFIVVVMPYQGHGWGYRYLHGMLGSVSLIAAYAWVQLGQRADVRARGMIVASGVFALCTLAVHLAQVRAMATSYIEAQKAIEHTDADYVVVDDRDIWFGQDLVRNDPYLRNRPKVMLLKRLDETLIDRLCAGKIAIFDRKTADAFGLVKPLNMPLMMGRTPELRDYMAAKGCGGTPVGSP